MHGQFINWAPRSPCGAFRDGRVERREFPNGESEKRQDPGTWEVEWRYSDRDRDTRHSCNLYRAQTTWLRILITMPQASARALKHELTVVQGESRAGTELICGVVTFVTVTSHNIHKQNVARLGNSPFGHKCDTMHSSL